jgi:hypothetical protein
MSGNGELDAEKGPGSARQRQLTTRRSFTFIVRD